VRDLIAIKTYTSSSTWYPFFVIQDPKNKKKFNLALSNAERRRYALKEHLTMLKHACYLEKYEFIVTWSRLRFYYRLNVSLAKATHLK